MIRAGSVYAAGLAGLILALPVAAQGFDRGQALYENHCEICHEPQVHTRADRRAASRSDIRKWVTTWSFHANLGWSDEEVDDVTNYLNRSFYRFTTHPER